MDCLGRRPDLQEIESALKDTGLELRRTEEGICLTQGDMELRGDYSGLLSRIRPEALSRELLVRAVERKGQDRQITVFDATAGLGEDSFLLAARGCRVILAERDPVIFALAEDAVMRAREDPRTRDAALRMELIYGDSTDILGRSFGSEPDSVRTQGADPARTQGADSARTRGEDLKVDVVYLDPMFPERRKSGLIKKKFQILQKLEAPESNEAGLLEAAMSSGAGRVVVKRPLKAPALGGMKPTFTLKGDRIRYDCLELQG